MDFQSSIDRFQWIMDGRGRFGRESVAGILGLKAILH
jgi:hypothetical protein